MHLGKDLLDMRHIALIAQGFPALLRQFPGLGIFLQQLGRGLRRTRDKAVLTVLDFVGFQRKEFKWERKLRALTGTSRKNLQRDIEQGFPFLPSGSQLVLDRVVERIVLDNVRQQLGLTRNLSTAEIVEQVMNGLEPTLPLPRNLELYPRESSQLNR